MLKVASFALQVATLVVVIWLIANHPAPARELAAWTAAAAAVLP
jgi:hypothetical protein